MVDKTQIVIVHFISHFNLSSLWKLNKCIFILSKNIVHFYGTFFYFIFGKNRCVFQNMVLSDLTPSILLSLKITIHSTSLY